jgi:hypothetical protein
MGTAGGNDAKVIQARVDTSELLTARGEAVKKWGGLPVRAEKTMEKTVFRGVTFSIFHRLGACLY